MLLKKITKGFTIVVACTMFATTAFAADVDVTTATPQMYTETIQLIPEMYATNTKTVNVAKMGLALDAGQSGWSAPVNASFYLPASAKVQQITFTPGTATGNTSTVFKGLVVADTLEITAPNGKCETFSWGKTITDSSKFFNNVANGKWTLRFHGKNVSSVTGSPIDDQFFGSISYKYPQLTIKYTM